jgi:hypothetical protein
MDCLDRHRAGDVRFAARHRAGAGGRRHRRASDVPVDNLTLADVRRIVLGDREFWPGSVRLTLFMRAPVAHERDVILKKGVPDDRGPVQAALDREGLSRRHRGGAEDRLFGGSVDRSRESNGLARLRSSTHPSRRAP